MREATLLLSCLLAVSSGWRATPVRTAGLKGLKMQLGAGQFSVRLPKPLGIAFEESTPNKAEGVVVSGLVDGGNAERDGRVLVGDRLIRVSAVQFAGQSAYVTLGSGTQFTSFKRELIPCTAMDFDTIMAAIGSNEGRYGYTDVVLILQHTDQSQPRSPSGCTARPRLEEADVTWNAADGASSNGKSTPLKPPPDSF
jgi:hypothetical protein